MEKVHCRSIRVLYGEQVEKKSCYAGASELVNVDEDEQGRPVCILGMQH